MDKFAPANMLLRSLSKHDLTQLQSHLELVDLRLDETLYEMEDSINWVYLPEVGLLSLITVLDSGAALETSIVGREGGVGFIEALGKCAKPSTCNPSCFRPKAARQLLATGCTPSRNASTVGC